MHNKVYLKQIEDDTTRYNQSTVLLTHTQTFAEVFNNNSYIHVIFLTNLGLLYILFY